jgi:hypothetical protein
LMFKVVSNETLSGISSSSSSFVKSLFYLFLICCFFCTCV